MVLTTFNMGLPPALIFIFGAALIPFLKGKWKSVYMLALPVVAFLTLLNTPNGNHFLYPLLDYQLNLGRIDGLSRAFGYIFVIVTFIGTIYAIKVKDNVQHVATFVYAGGALGVTFAGDLFSFYIFWESMAIASTFLILARKTKESQKAAFRYILVHIFGGLSLLGGIVIYVIQTGTLEFSFIGLAGLKDVGTFMGIAKYMIFFGVAINAAIPPLHGWLKDAYPEATVTGAVFLSSFTTKSAVYVMARMFPGADLLIWLGVAMTAIPIFYAVLENDIRRVLSYSLINQVGFMLCGVGIGTELAINGAVAHVFCHILYKSLLFMSAGAVLQMTGKIRCTDLGGLYKSMPFTALFCMVGAASISAFPLFSGFVSKSMIISAAGYENLLIVWLVFQFASAGVFHHAGIKVPYFMFFGHDSGLRPKEAPLNMLIAMGIAAFLCIYIGIDFEKLYAILPYPIEYVPYTGAHVVGQLQLLMFGALAFCLLILSGNYPAEMRSINLDFDWFYRKGGVAFYYVVDKVMNGINTAFDAVFLRGLVPLINRFAENIPAKTLLLFLVPVRSMAGEKEEELAAFKEKIRFTLDKGSLPIGITVAAAGLFMVVLYLLS